MGFGAAVGEHERGAAGGDVADVEGVLGGVDFDAGGVGLELAAGAVWQRGVFGVGDPAVLLLPRVDLGDGGFVVVGGDDLEEGDGVVAVGDQRFGDLLDWAGDLVWGQLLVALQLLHARQGVLLVHLAGERAHVGGGATSRGVRRRERGSRVAAVVRAGAED